ADAAQLDAAAEGGIDRRRKIGQKAVARSAELAEVVGHQAAACVNQAQGEIRLARAAGPAQQDADPAEGDAGRLDLDASATALLAIRLLAIRGAGRRAHAPGSRMVKRAPATAPESPVRFSA